MASFAYDLLGNPARTVDPAGNVTSYRFNSVGQKIAQVDPDLGASSSTYDGAGRVIAEVDGSGRRTDYTYDPLGRVVSKVFTSADGAAESVTYTYDEARDGFANIGALTTMSDAAGATTFDRDAAGRTSRRTRTLDGTTYTFLFAHDAGGRLIGTRYPDGDVVGDDPSTAAVETPLGYDASGRLTSIPGLVTGVLYDPSGFATKISNANGTVTTRRINAARGWLESILTIRGPEYLVDLTYTRDAAGKILSVTSPRAGDRWTYGYDGLARLISSAGTTEAAQTFAYDALGNLVNNSRLGGLAYPAAGAPRPHAVVSAPGKTYGYDDAGHLLEGGGRRYEWNAADRLASVTMGDHVTTFVYDGEGERLAKIHDGVVTLTPDLDYEIDHLGTVTKYFRIGGELVAKKVDARRFWMQGDHLGSVGLITDEAGNQVRREEHRAYGEVLATTGAHQESHGFTGQRTDETGLIYLRARYYDPEIGRFVSPDTATPGDSILALNRYAYANDDPVNFTDPTGHSPEQPYGRDGHVYRVNSAGHMTEVSAHEVPKHSILYVNGIANKLECPNFANCRPQYIATNSGKDVYWVYNKTDGMAKDVGQAAKDKMPYLMRNKASNTVWQILEQTDGDVDIHAHSQGTIISTDALQAFHRGHGFWGVFHSGEGRGDFKGTFYMYGNAVWFPPNVRTRSYVNDSDWVNIPLGSSRGSNVTRSRGGHSDYLCPGCNDPWTMHYSPPEPPLPMDPPPARRGGGGCFVAGTRVTMADGTSRAIEDIQVGERVLALDEQTGRVLPAAVTRVFVHPDWRERADTILIDGRVRATGNHYFLVNGEWKRADQIEPGDRLRRLSGLRDDHGNETMEPETVQTLIPMPGVDTVYNLEVEAYHTYFVEGVLVHNRKAIPI